MAPHVSLRHVQPMRLFTTAPTTSAAIAASATFTQRRSCASSAGTGPHASSTSSSSQETKHTSSDSGPGSGSGAAAQRVHMQTLGDYLAALPRGFRELLLYSPALALLCFVLYQQKTYFRDPGEAWYHIFNPWRSRRVGGWLLHHCDDPLPALHPTVAKPDTATTSRVAIALCESEALQDTKMGGPAAHLPAAIPTPPIAPFSSHRCAHSSSSRDNDDGDVHVVPQNEIAQTVWGDDVYAVRALRHGEEQGSVYGYQLVTVQEWQNSCNTAQSRGGWRAWVRCLFAS